MEVTKSDSNILNEVFHNIHIIENIFSNLDLSNLKNVRLVCRHWSHEAFRGFKNKIFVHHDPTILRKIDPISITKFLQNHKILYTLVISFLNNSWYDCKPKDPSTLRRKKLLFKKYLKQRNNKKYLKVLSNSFLQSSSAVYLTELRIELNIFHENDADLLVTTLSKTVKLEILAIDLVLVKKKKVKSLPDELLVPLNNLKLLAFRCGYYGSDYAKSEVLDLECWTKILGLFPGIKYLDLISWQQGWIREAERHDGSIELCSQALEFLIKEKQYFQYLEGWRYDKMYRECPVHGNIYQNDCPLVPFSQQLKYLVIRGNETANEIFIYNLQSLKRCELFLITNNDVPRLEQMIRFPLPMLEYLGLCIDLSYKISDLEKANILKFRDIISGGAESFKRIFPKLHTVNIAVSRKIEKEYFNYLFPKEVNIKIPGITSLGISLTADCESEEITRVYSMFPDLEILKHVREGDECELYLICTHTQDKKTKKFIPVTNNPVQIVKDPDEHHCNSQIYTHLVYYQLRGTLCVEPFYWGYNVVEWSPDMETAIETGITKILMCRYIISDSDGMLYGY